MKLKKNSLFYGLSMIGILVFFYFTTTFELLALDREVKDLILDGEVEGDQLYLNVKSFHEGDSKVVIPINTNVVTYTSDNEVNGSSSRYDKIQNQIVIEWSEHQEKNTEIILEIHQKNNYQFRAETIRNDKRVFSNMYSLEGEIVSSDTNSSQQQTTDIEVTSETKLDETYSSNSMSSEVLSSETYNSSNSEDNIEEESTPIETKIDEEDKASEKVLSGKWGTANWIFSEGVLTLKNGTLGVEGESPWSVGGELSRHAIQKIIFEEQVVAPDNSKNLFYYLPNLTDISGNLDTTNTTFMDGMFSYSNKIKILDINHWDMSNVKSINGMFKMMSALEVINVSNWNTSKIQDMSFLFSGDNNLREVNVSNWNTSNVINMERMFESTQNLMVLDVSNWDTSSVISTSYMFYGNKSLSQLDVSNWDIQNIENMGHMFEGTNFKYLNVSNWNTEKVKTMESMFANMHYLEAIDVSLWNVPNVKNMSNMFSTNMNLKTIDVRNWNTKSVETMDSMFRFCYDLNNIDVSKWDTSNVKNVSFMFQFARALDDINLNQWNTQKITNMEYMFYAAINLKELNLSNWDTSNVINFEFMFAESTIEKLNLSNFKVSSNRVRINGIFEKMNKLKKINLGKNFKQILDSRLPSVSTYYPYFGKWRFEDTDLTVTSEELMNIEDRSSLDGWWAWTESRAEIKTKDTIVYRTKENTWQPQDNFILAIDDEGNKIELRNIKVVGDVDTSKFGEMHANYSFQSNSINPDTGREVIISNVAKITVRTGTLSFEEVPSELNFIESNISNRAQEIPRENPSWMMTVLDDRDIKTNWSITANLITPFKDSKGEEINPLFYRESGLPDQHIDSTNNIEVFKYEYKEEKPKLTLVRWPSTEGLILKVRPGQVNADSYEGVIQWTIVQAP